MTARSTEELIQSLATRISGTFGNNPLFDPVANRSNNLVKLVTAIMTGQAELEKRIEAFKFQYQQSYIEGDALDFLAASKCLTRTENVKSKALLAVSGEDCAVLQSGSVTTDSLGREWVVSEDIELSANGTPCAFGVGVVEASEFGCWMLDAGELSFDNSNSPQIYSATNSVMLEKGGALESNDAFRDRISNTGALSLINGTTDNVSAALMQVDGVEFVRAATGTFCGETGGLIVVQGGLDSDICNVIKSKIGLNCSLLGDVDCSANCFDEVRFQRPIPVKIDVEVTLNDDCPMIDQVQAESIIRAQSGSLARGSRISASQLTKLHPDILNIRFRTVRQELGCSSDEVFMNPFDGTEEPFFTTQAFGINSGVTACFNESQEFNSSVRFPIYEMPVLNEITFISPQVLGACNPCV